MGRVTVALSRMTGNGLREQNAADVMLDAFKKAAPNAQKRRVA
jgi:hypothetical protein